MKKGNTSDSLHSCTSFEPGARTRQKVPESDVSRPSAKLVTSRISTRSAQPRCSRVSRGTAAPDDSALPRAPSFIDLFFSGNVADAGAGQPISGIDGEYVATIPEPPGYSGLASQLAKRPLRQHASEESDFIAEDSVGGRGSGRRSSSRGIFGGGVLLQASAAGEGYRAGASTNDDKRVLENLVQDFWKVHAGLPQPWPGLEECRELQRDFAHWCHVTDLGKAGAKHRPYVVMASTEVRVRRSPSVDDTADCPGETLSPGQCVVANGVVGRRDGRYVRLARGGWVAETLRETRVLSEAAELELGPIWYQVISLDFVEARRVPTCSNWARNGFILCPKEVCTVGLRCIVDGVRFLQLADGRGWIFESIPMEEPGSSSRRIIMAECASGAGPRTREEGATETGLWRYQVLERPVLAIGTRLHGMVLEPGESFYVCARIRGGGLSPRIEKDEESRVESFSPRTSRERRHWFLTERVWLRLVDGRGWVPKIDELGAPFVCFVGPENSFAEKDPPRILSDGPASTQVEAMKASPDNAIAPREVHFPLGEEKAAAEAELEEKEDLEGLELTGVV